MFNNRNKIEMKTRIFLSILTGVFFVAGLSSCKKTCTINVNESNGYKSENYHVINPNIGIFGDNDTTTSRIVIEHIDILGDLGLEQTMEEMATKKSPAGIFKPTLSDKGNAVNVPITSLTIDRFAMQEESEAQLTNPLIDYVSRFDVIIQTAESTVYPTHGQTSHGQAEEFLLASYEVNDSSISVGSGGSGLLQPFHFETTGYNLIPFLEDNPDFYIEIITTFKKVPKDIRAFTYNFGITCEGNFEGKCK